MEVALLGRTSCLLIKSSHIHIIQKSDGSTQALANQRCQETETFTCLRKPKSWITYILGKERKMTILRTKNNSYGEMSSRSGGV